MQSAYITAFGKHLPGEPIPSDEIEEYIGAVGPSSSALREKVVANSGIQKRHYGIDKRGESLTSAEEMAAEAIRDAVARSPIELDDIELLAIAGGFGTGDVLAPGLGPMVHGELRNPPCELVSIHGICASGMMALKNAVLQIRVGDKNNAVAAGCEYISRGLKSSRHQALAAIEGDGDLAFEIAFLRYMLSDGAGAMVLQPSPREEGLSFRVDWIEIQSFANTTEECMYIGLPRNGNGRKSWLDYPTVEEAAADGAFALRQNMRLLPRLILKGVGEWERLVAEGKLDPTQIRWVLSHWSSMALKDVAVRALAKRGIELPPEDRWFTNLPDVGNMGTASMYVILEEFARTQPVEPGDQILCFCPESGRFTICYMLLTAVGPEG